MRALVIAPEGLGDAVQAQPLLALLKSREPRPSIDWLSASTLLPVGAAIAEVDRLIEAPDFGDRLRLADRWRLARRLAVDRYDQAYVLPESARAALLPWLAGISRRIGHRGEHRRWMLDTVHDPLPGPADPGPITGRAAPRNAGTRATGEPLAAHYARLALPPGAPLPDPMPEPRLACDATAAAAVRTRLAIPAGPVVVLAAGARVGPARRWPARLFAALADRIAETWPEAQVLLLGTMDERPLATEIAAMSAGPVRNLCGETTLGDALALVAQAEGVVTNDSGLMHVAAAYRRPQVAVFGPSDPRRGAPRSPRARVLWQGLDCSPCFARDCPLGHGACLAGIRPETVFEALADAMEKQR